MKKSSAFPEALEVVYIADETIACDGGGAVGHPRVYLTVDRDTHSVDCGYCDRRFVQDAARAGTKAKTAH